MILVINLVSRAAIHFTTIYLATVSSAVSMCSSAAVIRLIAGILTLAIMTAAVRRRVRVFIDDGVPAFCG